MKPTSGLSSLTKSVGAPWEIYRLSIPVSPDSNRTRVSDLYTKAGGNSGYSAVFALSPDYGIGYSILVAGPGALDERWPLRDAVGEVFLPAAEHGAAENAARNFAGTFADESSLSNITLTVDDDHPGLGLRAPGAEGVTVRLYPAGFTQTFNNGSTFISFRAVPQALPVGLRAEVEGGEGLFDNACDTWFSVGFFGSLDEFILEVVDNKVERLRNMGSGKILNRVDS